MAKLLKIVPPVKPTSQAEIRAMLSVLNDCNESGELDGLAIFAVKTNGENHTSFSNAEDTLKFIGGLSYLLFRMQREYNERA